MQSFMTTGSLTSSAASWVRVDAAVAAFEAARSKGVGLPISQFLPDKDHPLYSRILLELVRVDIELAWQAKRKVTVESYLAEFPELGQDPSSLQAIAFEEFRQREIIGEKPSPSSFAKRFGISTTAWRTSTIDESARSDQSQWQSLTSIAQAYREHGAGKIQHSDDSLWENKASAEPAVTGLFRDLHRTAPESADRLARALTSWPKLGTSFAGFKLIDELGRGAFGRVYLAKQEQLAQRLVALKISTDIFGESQTLARLQHTSIVPIFSVHHVDPFQAVCMPYLGSATLVDVLRQLGGPGGIPTSGKMLVSTIRDRQPSTVRTAPVSPSGEPGNDPGHQPILREADSPLLAKFQDETYVDTVLWIATQVVEGLQHAHERGIFHRDLKPANVLLTDDGQPMLLDFNLAENHANQQAKASIGGTLRYMAPEHLRAFAGQKELVDGRSDLYSLGLILFELLTGHHPFREVEGLSPGNLDLMLATRSGSPPSLRQWNGNVPPAVESIVRHCLEPVQADRYQSATELLEDLQREQASLPLLNAPNPSMSERLLKWKRRHPKLSSAGSIMVLSSVLVVGLVCAYWWQHDHASRMEARAQLEQATEQMHAGQALLYDRQPEADQARQGELVCLAALSAMNDSGRKKVSSYLSETERGRLEDVLGELHYLAAHANVLQSHSEASHSRRRLALENALALNREAESRFPRERFSAALFRQRAELAELLGDAELAKLSREQAAGLTPETTRDLYLTAHGLAQRQEFAKALSLLREATRRDPKSFSAWMVQGNCHGALGQEQDALAAYTACIALRPAFYGSWFNRGLIYLKQRHFQMAERDFDQAIQLRPDLSDAYINRALSRQGLGKLDEAITDLGMALEHGTPRTRVYFLRSRIMRAKGDIKGADADFATGLEKEPSDEKSYIARGLARLPRAPELALADFQSALRLNPRSIDALQNQAHVLSEILARPAEAVTALNAALRIAPDHVPAIAGRGVLLARMGKLDDALADARAALSRDSSAPNLYQIAGIFALRATNSPEDRFQALQLLSTALRAGFGHDLLDRDPELLPLKDDPDFKRIVAAARNISAPTKKP